MNNEHDNHENEKTTKEQSETTQETTSDAGEFKLTVRKLEMPVRPRGVLAE